MNRTDLANRLAERFGGSPGEQRAVARTAGDLADSGQYQTDADVALTPEVVISELEDAPEEMSGPAERWNWWIGSLELAYGGYERFQVTQWSE